MKQSPFQLFLDVVLVWLETYFVTYRCSGCGRTPRIARTIELSRGWRCWACDEQMGVAA